MPAPQKQSLDWYVCEVGGWQKDRRLVKLNYTHGRIGRSIYEDLNDMIRARKGYYLEFSSPKDLAEDLLTYSYDRWIKTDKVVAVIDCCISLGLFDYASYKNNVITSVELQEHFIRVSMRRKPLTSYPHWLLKDTPTQISKKEEWGEPSLNAPKNREYANNNRVNVNNNPVNVNNNSLSSSSNSISRKEIEDIEDREDKGGFSSSEKDLQQILQSLIERQLFSFGSQDYYQTREFLADLIKDVKISKIWRCISHMLNYIKPAEIKCPANYIKKAILDGLKKTSGFVEDSTSVSAETKGKQKEPVVLEPIIW